MTRLAGKVAFITGGASGLGRVGAERFAAEGARVVIADVGDASQTLQAIAQAGGTAASVACDVSSDASVRDAVAFAVETFGEFELLVVLERLVAEYQHAVFVHASADFGQHRLVVQSA